MDKKRKLNHSEKSKLNLDRLMHRKLDRRSFLRIAEKMTGLITGAGLISSIPFVSFGRSSSEESTAPFIKSSLKSLNFPFKLGVASGDPLPDGMVLWTRLAPDPLNGGGMPSKPVEVQWEAARDDSFRNIVKQGTVVADPAHAHSVHAEIEGLEPDQWYFYRFKMGEEISPTGRTKTTPAPGASVDHLEFAFASCQNYPAGHYTAYDHLVKENIDVLFFLGDYIYEGGAQGNLGRGHLPGKGIFSLDEYRTRHAQYKSDPSLQAAHAAFPWIVTFDDHEVKNNWGGEGPPYDDNEQFLARRAAAFQAYYEHMPLRKSSIPDDINIQLYRRFTFGNLAEFNMLDTRQYRTDLTCGGGLITNCPERFNPSRTMLGTEQEQWLFNGLESSDVSWNVLAQQVMVAQRDRKKGAKVALHMDKWDGFTATRNRLIHTVQKNSVSNLVVLTGDQHSNWVNELKEDFNDSNSPVWGTEFVGTSISSGGNGIDIGKQAETALAENPHIKFFNAQRGYVRCRLTPDRWRADFRVVPYVDKPGAPIRTRASFVVKNGTPGVTHINPD